MASTVKKRNPPGREKGHTPLISEQRKKEVLGLVVMVVSFLVCLAVFTYDEADNLLARRFTLDSLFSPGDERAANALGLTGAAIARLLVPSFLGYCVILLPLMGLGWGYVWLRHRSPSHMRLVTILLAVGAFFSAGIFGWFATTLGTDLESWSGALGLGTAGWMQQILGTTGSLAILLLALVVTILLLVDHDIQRSIDRVESRVMTWRDGIESWWVGRSLRKEERQERRALLLEEQRKDREARKKEDARKREEERLRPRQENTPAVRDHSDSPASGESSTAALPSADARLRAPTRSGSDTREFASDVIQAGAEGEVDVPIEVHGPVVEERSLSRSRKNTISEYEFEMPPSDLLDESRGGGPRIDYDELEENKQILLDKLAMYNIEIVAIDAIVGPTVTLYELTPAPGVKISRITALENDLAMALAARGIRMIAPIPGKTAIGVEIPNRNREFVRIREIIETRTFNENRMELPLILGKSIEGEVVLQDLTKMPHVLIAGSTGSGKSVGLNNFIAGLLYSVPPSLLKFVMIDPKKIELSAYTRIMPHYVAMPPEAEDAIITDVAQALGTLKSCEKEMEARYDFLAAAQVRSIREYNERFRKGSLSPDEGHRLLPYIVVVVDELADLMMTAGKDIEGPIARLAQMSRAVGIHLMLATQRPSVDVITGLIKANFPCRIAYQVASKIDSRTILDQNGAEGLVGNGDMLFMLGSRVIRLQAPFVSIEEIDRVTGFIGDQEGPGPYLLPSIEEDHAGPAFGSVSGGGERDELFDEAARIIVRAQQGSVSLLQRKLSVGYSRAARIVDQLEDAGIVGPFEGSKARQVLVEDDMQLDNLLSP